MLLTIVLCLQEQEGSSSDNGGKGHGYSDFPFVVTMSVLEDFFVYYPTARAHKSNTRIVLCALAYGYYSYASAESKLVLALDTVQEFVCSAPAGDKYDIIWSVNGPLGEDAIAQFPEYLNVTHHESSNGTQQTKTLHFTAATPVNNTHLKCVVVNITTLSDPSSILVFNMNIAIQGQDSSNSSTECNGAAATQEFRVTLCKCWYGFLSR